MRVRAMTPLVVALFGLAASVCGPAQAQQFSSDNYLSKPHGVATLILTAGERSDTVIHCRLSRAFKAHDYPLL